MHQQHLLFPFLILLPFSCLLFTSSSQATFQRYLDCLPVPFTCGGLHTNISYPFRIDSRRDYCGYPGFYLNCTNNNTTLTITMNGTLYIVKDLDYFNHIITIMNSDFSGHPCPLTYTNTITDTTIFEFYDRNQMLNLYLNCSSPSIPSSLVSIPCLLEQTGNRSYFSLLSDGLQGFIPECSSTAMIPVKEGEAARLSNNSTAFGDVLQEGFMLKWIAGRGWCSFCINSGGVCAYDGNNPLDQTCYCPYGSTTGVCSEGTLFIKFS
ncbi:Wall-associated receptor kinase galacturonan-binding domain-containing protein [Dioscorea alata]|uniref:Wall-associated receptor kinase galacturonan-binding domain-containing protein n=1 Tax=Dioscorea alata TaxID=55571 RepID=A0ACB7W4Q2_DIOAL|nr:Wall-associated receptor kinase galacturonan-binding domain-containing protein [Dioscorea alata]